jgi:hypothetical protein
MELPVDMHPGPPALTRSGLQAARPIARQSSSRDLARCGTGGCEGGDRRPYSEQALWGGLLACVLLLSLSQSAAAQVLSATGSMNFGRSYFPLIRLLDGRVLAAGAKSTGFTDAASAELFDPVTGRSGLTSARAF